MSFKSVLTGVTLAASLSLVSCGWWGDDDKEDGTPRAPSVTLSEIDVNAVITLEPGQDISVSLPATAGTGFVWSLEQKAEGVLRQMGEVHYSARPMLPNMMGQTGINTWIFRATAEGQDRLSYTYHRPWSSDTPVKTLSWTINVGKPALAMNDN